MNKLLIAIVILFASCTYPSENNTIVEITGSLCKSTDVLYTTSNSGKFWARRGLYNIGDTLKFK